jgi:hypothetical protein
LQQISRTFAALKSTKLPEIDEKCDLIQQDKSSGSESEDEQEVLSKRPIPRHVLDEDDETFSDSELDQRQDSVRLQKI